MKKFVLALAAVVAAAAAVAQSTVHVEQPWVRSTVAQQTTTSAYMTITAANGGRLVAARSPVAASVELHQMTMTDNVMRMRSLGSLPLPAGQAVELSAGGLHLMLMGLKHQVKAGEIVPIELDVLDAQGRRETVEVGAVARNAK